MIIRYAGYYLKNNKVKLLPLFFCVTFLSSLILLTIFTKNACSYLSDEVKKDIKYEAYLEGRMCSEKNFNMYFDVNENIEEEYLSVKSFLISNDARFQPVLESVVPSQFFCISNNIDLFMGNNNYEYSVSSVCLYGVEEPFFGENQIEIIEGRNFEAHENGKIIINENTYQIIDGKPSLIEIGDVISLPVGIVSYGRPEDFEPEIYLEYEVIGKYRERKVDVLSSDTKDYKLNRRYYISKEDTMFHLESFFDIYREYGKKPALTVDSRVSFYLPRFTFNNVCFCYENENDLENGIKDIDSFVQGINYRINEAHKNEENFQENVSYDDREKKPYYSLNSSLDLASSLLSPLEMVEKDISIFLAIDGIISVFILLLFFGFQFRNRKKEFAIKEVMGLKEKDLIAEIAIENYFVSTLAFIAGFAIYRFSGKIVVNTIFNDSIAIQNSLIRIISGRIDALTDYKAIQISYHVLENEWLIYLVLYLATTILVSLISCFLFEKTKPKNLHRILTCF